MIADRPSRLFFGIEHARRPLHGVGAGDAESAWAGHEELITPVLMTARSMGETNRECARARKAFDQATTLTPGRRLGPFELLERVGQGGQGDVWKTRRGDASGELVALKVLKPELAHNPARAAQFRREAQRGPRLIGPSLLAAQELCEIDGFHCMTMPFVECTSLRDVIKWRLAYQSGEETERLHPLVGLDRVDYLVAVSRAIGEAAAALALAHEKRIVHRDVKPANLLVDKRIEAGVYLCDFGLGRDLDFATTEQMRDGAGTPIYMAPERLLMFAADEIKCDIYSTGVTLYEALLLEKPFRVPAHVSGPSVAPYLATAEPKPVRRIDSDFPEELEAVITKAMARDPARRFESAGELADSLKEFVAQSRCGRCASKVGRPAQATLRGPHGARRQDTVSRSLSR